MTITCSQLDDLLLEGDAFSMDAAARHGHECGACRGKLEEWNDIGDAARGLRAEWNSDLLWPRIDRALRAEHRGRHARLWQVAASFAIFLGLAGIIWVAAHRVRQAEFDNAILRVSRMDEVQRAERAHLAAINELQTLAQPKLDQPATPLMVSYKEKLMMLDDAIAECQSNIDHNRQNAYLRKQLATIYSEKQRTLQDVLREETHVQENVQNR
jgi:hypothetical protein